MPLLEQSVKYSSLQNFRLYGILVLFVSFPQAAGEVCNCAFFQGPDSPDTPEIQLYSILGRLGGCERVAVNISQVSVPSGCGCTEEQFIEVGGSPVLVEGGVCMSGKNVTVAMVNTCNCTLSLDLRCVCLWMHVSACLSDCVHMYILCVCACPCVSVSVCTVRVCVCT